jgi:hypothetical protein
MPHVTPKKRKKTPKRVLALPDLEHAKSAVLITLTSHSGQRTYDHAIREFVAWYCSEPRLAFNRTVVLRYRIHREQRRYARERADGWHPSALGDTSGPIDTTRASAPRYGAMLRASHGHPRYVRPTAS